MDTQNQPPTEDAIVPFRQYGKHKREINQKIRADLKELSERFDIPIVTNVDELKQIAGKIAQKVTNLKGGGAYIRYSSEAQVDSLSLSAQLRQIIERAAADGAEIVVVFADAAQSAYYKRDRPAIKAMFEAAKLNLMELLYAHKVDRLARRVEWFIYIMKELDESNVVLCIVDQHVDLLTPEGKLIAGMLSSLAQFYSENLSNETGKGRYESWKQGYHNGAPPLGYYSARQGSRKVGQIHPEVGPLVKEMFERYSTGLYSDQQLMKWLEAHPVAEKYGIALTKDGIRELLQNPYYTGKLRYKGHKVRQKDVTYRKTPALLGNGLHQPLIDEDLFDRCRVVRAERASVVAIRQKTARTHLLQAVAFCSECGTRLWAQTLSNCETYYREPSNLRPGCTCSKAGHSAPAKVLEKQVANLIRALQLPTGWQAAVQEELAKEQAGPDPEIERREIRTQLRRLRDNYEMGQYTGEEYVYRQKVNVLQQKLSLLQRVPDTSLNKAACALLSLNETWDWATREEQHKLIRMLFYKVACDVVERRVVWVQPRRDFDPLFRVLAGFKRDEQGHYWVEQTPDVQPQNENL